MFSLTDLYDYFTAEEIISAINSHLSTDDRVDIIHTMLDNHGIYIPEEIEKHYDLHCR